MRWIRPDEKKQQYGESRHLQVQTLRVRKRSDLFKMVGTQPNLWAGHCLAQVRWIVMD